MTFDITINTDEKYVQHAMATLCSLYENNKEHKIVVHILQKDLSEESKKIFINLADQYENSTLFYSVNEELLQGVQFRKNRPLSMAAYYRLLLSSILPQSLDKVLYLDCDMIILRDISEIFKIELEQYALAASLDNFPYDQQHRLQLHMEVGERTFCSGIMLVNLKYWRDHNVEPLLLEYAKRRRDVVYFHDQDVLNYAFKRKWFLLPPKWNRTACQLRPIKSNLYQLFDRRDYVLAPMLFHYASLGVKPWYDAVSPEKDAYMKYVRLSGLKNIKFEKVSLLKKIKLMKLNVVYNMKKMVLKLFRCF